MDWYYEKEGAQQGPVNEEDLKRYFETSRISAGNLVWREGMADWAPYGSVFEVSDATLAAGQVACPTCRTPVDPSQLIPAGDRQVCPHCREDFAQRLREGARGPGRSGASLGTGGSTPNAELRALARDALTGKWFISVLVLFLYGVLQQLGNIIPVLGVVIAWLIMGALQLGLSDYFMRLNRGEAADVGALFSGFSQFIRGLGLYFVTTVLVSAAAVAAAIPGILVVVFVMNSGPGALEDNPLGVVGILLAVVPAVVVGIYMYLRYALVYYIANDDPDSGVMEPISRSVRMMQGRKGKLFCLYLSFIGWHILGFLAFFIGILWSAAYNSAAVAAFYDDLGDEG